LIFKTNLPKIFQKVLEEGGRSAASNLDHEFKAPGLNIKFDLEIVKKGKEKIDKLKKTITQKVDEFTDHHHFGSSLIDDVDLPGVKEEDLEEISETKTGFVDFASLVAEDSPILKEFSDLDDLLRAVLKTQIKQISFVQEITAKKWVYLGEYLEHYPNIYYNVSDRLSYQDIGLLQVLLSMDNTDDATCPDSETKGSPFKQQKLGCQEE